MRALKLLIAIICFPFRLLQLLVWRTFWLAGHRGTLALLLLFTIYAAWRDNDVISAILMFALLVGINQAFARLATMFQPPASRIGAALPANRVAEPCFVKVALPPARGSADLREIRKALPPHLQKLLRTSSPVRLVS